MSVINLFSKRRKALRGDVPDVYTYDKIPQPLRVQIIEIWRETLGNEDQYNIESYGTFRIYKAIVQALCREYGCFTLPGVQDQYGGGRHAIRELAEFLLKENDPDKVLDAIELSFKCIDHTTRDFAYLHRSDSSERADSAIEELNERFREHGVGYQFDGEIIRVDSQLLHKETVRPALGHLRAPEYAGAQAEFLAAHEHYRHGRTKEALNECLKALESVMKVICAKHKWKHAPDPTARVLIQTLLDHDLIPPFWQQHFSALRSTLEAGVPTARNKLGGHGQGSNVVEVPSYLAGYVLHMTAAGVVFLAEAEKALP